VACPTARLAAVVGCPQPPPPLPTSVRYAGAVSRNGARGRDSGLPPRHRARWRWGGGGGRRFTVFGALSGAATEWHLLHRLEREERAPPTFLHGLLGGASAPRLASLGRDVDGGASPTRRPSRTSNRITLVFRRRRRLARVCSRARPRDRRADARRRPPHNRERGSRRGTTPLAPVSVTSAARLSACGLCARRTGCTAGTPATVC